MISEIQHHIDNINQKEAFAEDDTTKQLVKAEEPSEEELAQIEKFKKNGWI